MFILQIGIDDLGYNNLRRREYIYDDNNILTRDFWSRWIDEEWVNDNSRDYSYDARENNTYALTQKWIDTTSIWVDNIQTFFYYQFASSIDDVVNDNLVVEEKGIYSIEKFLIARRLMYWQVYLHKTVVSSENMLIKVLQRAKELINIKKEIYSSSSLALFLNNNYTLADFETKPQLLNAFAELDDQVHFFFNDNGSNFALLRDDPKAELYAFVNIKKKVNSIIIAL